MSDLDLSKNVINFAEAKAKKEVKEELASGRKPLYISHIDGKLQGSPHLKEKEADDFGDRLTRIKSTLEKINRLMSELRRTAKSDATEAASTSNKPISIIRPI